MVIYLLGVEKLSLMLEATAVIWMLRVKFLEIKLVNIFICILSEPGYVWAS